MRHFAWNASRAIPIGTKQKPLGHRCWPKRTLHLGHLHIHQHQIVRQRSQRFQGFASVGCAIGGEAQFPEDAQSHLLVGHIVLHQRDPGLATVKTGKRFDSRFLNGPDGARRRLPHRRPGPETPDSTPRASWREHARQRHRSARSRTRPFPPLGPFVRIAPSPTRGPRGSKPKPEQPSSGSCIA